MRRLTGAAIAMPLLVEPERRRSRHTIVMTRRDALRLAVFAAIASPLAAACGDGGKGNREPGTATELELVKSDLRRSAGEPDAIPDVVAALHALAGGLYGRLAAEPGNLVLSPYSVGVALGMTLPGAGGRTAAEMRDVLGVTTDARFHGGLNALTGARPNWRWTAPTSSTDRRASAGSGTSLTCSRASTARDCGPSTTRTPTSRPGC